MIVLKVCICCLNSKYVHASLAPWCLYSAVKSNACEDIYTEVIESTINSDVDVVVNKIIDGSYDIASFSCYIWNITKTLEICEKIKKATGITIILGGPEVSYRAKNVLESYSFIDYVLSGEGEETFPTLLDKLNISSDFSNISGLTYRLKNSIISNPEKEYVRTPPSPYCDEFFNNLNNRISYIETSRGCPYRCAFCLSGRCSPLRFFDMDSVKENIIKLSNSGTKTIKFVDRTFNADAKRANEILNFILEKHGNEIPENVCFHFEIAGDILKEETLDILKSAPKGLFQLEIGMQSFNEKTLAFINRKTNSERLIKNIKRLVSFGNMHIHIDLIAGLPYEDAKSFEESFDIGYQLKANMLQMGFLKLLYGAEMRENKEKYPCEFSKDPPYEVKSTPWLSTEELEDFKKCEDALDRLYNSGRFIYTLNYLIDDCKYTPFRLFMEVGKAIDGNKMALSEYATRLFSLFKNKTDKELLREALICDLLSCSSALQVPEILKIKDPLLKKITKHFTEGQSDKIKLAILYKQKKVFVVNQSKPKGFDGRYEGVFYDLSLFENF